MPSKKPLNKAKKTSVPKKMKIVCLGGGNLMPKVLLEPLKKYPVDLTGITSMVDSGGAAGQFRQHFNVLPPGDIRRHVLALSHAPQWKKDLWKFRFGDEVFPDGHKGHVFANAFISGLEVTFNDHRKAMAIVTEFMELGGNRALPMIIDKVHIYAELEDGQVVEGEGEIEVPTKRDANLKIKKIFPKPIPKMFAASKKAILEADLILIGPGDLYSSIVPCFMASDSATIFKKTKAKKILISNTVSRKGETHGFTIKKFADEVEKYMGSDLDKVIYHNKPIDRNLLDAYAKKNSMVCEPLPIEEDLDKKKFIGADMLMKNEFAYDPKKVIRGIFKLINY